MASRGPYGSILLGQDVHRTQNYVEHLAQDATGQRILQKKLTYYRLRKGRLNLQSRNIPSSRRRGSSCFTNGETCAPHKRARGSTERERLERAQQPEPSRGAGEVALAANKDGGIYQHQYLDPLLFQRDREELPDVVSTTEWLADSDSMV